MRVIYRALTSDISSMSTTPLQMIPRLGVQVRNLSQIRNWNESGMISDRKSRFQARNVDLHDASDLPEIISQFLEQHKSISKSASHPHILAWRTGERLESTAKGPVGYRNINQGFKDNGEKGAGSKLLDFLVQRNVINKVVIVTRWYGGAHIGASRFRHIISCSADSLKRSRDVPS